MLEFNLEYILPIIKKYYRTELYYFEDNYYRYFLYDLNGEMTELIININNSYVLSKYDKSNISITYYAKDISEYRTVEEWVLNFMKVTNHSESVYHNREYTLSKLKLI